MRSMSMKKERAKKWMRIKKTTSRPEASICSGLIEIHRNRLRQNRASFSVQKNIDSKPHQVLGAFVCLSYSKLTDRGEQQAKAVTKVKGPLLWDAILSFELWTSGKDSRAILSHHYALNKQIALPWEYGYWMRFLWIACLLIRFWNCMIGVDLVTPRTLEINSFSILFKHRSVQKPAVSQFFSFRK